MRSTFDRLNRVLSATEIEVAKMVIREIREEDMKIVTFSRVADETKIARSVITGTLRLLEAAGVIEARSMGMKGTYIKVLDHETLEQLATI